MNEEDRTMTGLRKTRKIMIDRKILNEILNRKRNEMVPRNWEISRSKLMILHSLSHTHNSFIKSL